MEVLNQAYAETPFRFKLMGTTAAPQANWTTWAIDYQAEISEALGVHDLKVLNVFVAYDVGDDLLGFAVFPEAQSNATGDGVYVRYDFLTSGGSAVGNLGYLLVHEVGHCK